MVNLNDYLINHEIPFSNDEKDMLLMVAYSIIRATIRYIKEKNANIFYVYEDRVVYKDRHGRIINKIDQPADLRPYFFKILKQDIIIAEHLFIINETDDYTQYKLHL